MIRLSHIYKSYDHCEVLHDFSYEFPETGLFLLYGVSGCGKSTLINLIAEIIKADAGDIHQEIKNGMCYITQDAFLVDYLTVLENLKLSNQDVDLIIRTAEEFEVSQNLQQYPKSLSGGEKQRIALMRAFLENKKVLLLDEPTASLDSENKKKIFETLNRMKKEKLIICACHDPDIMKYCDEIIDMQQLQQNVIEDNNEKKMLHSADGSCRQSQQSVAQIQVTDNKEVNKKTKDRKSFQTLLGSVSRQYRTNGKVELLMMVLIFLIVNMILAYCFDFSGKLQNSLEKLDHVNVLSVGIHVENNNQSFLDKIKDEFEIVDYVFMYGLNAPQEKPDPNTMVDPNDFEDVQVLPFSEDAFYYSDHMLYGSYFTKEDQIILGLEEARSINVNPQTLIGQELSLKLYDDTYVFEIVGIFDKMDTDFVHYLQAADNDAGADFGRFISSKFANRYAWDGVLGVSETDYGKAVYNLYFDSVEDMRAFRKSADDYADQLEIEKFVYFSEFTLGTASNSLYLYPVAYSLILGALFLYYMLKNIRMTYAQKNISVYQYYGYSYGSVYLAYMMYNLIELTIAYLFAAVAAIGMVAGINMLNEQFRFSEFFLFEMDGRRMFYLYLIMVIFNIISTGLTFFRLKSKGWYFLLSERRDLI